MKKKEFLEPISSEEILNALFGFLSTNDLSTNVREYIKFMEEMKSILRFHLLEKKSTTLNFSCDINKELIIECAIIEVEESFVLARVVKTKKGSSLDLTNSIKKLFFVDEKKFLKGVCVHDYVLSEKLLSVD